MIDIVMFPQLMEFVISSLVGLLAGTKYAMKMRTRMLIKSDYDPKIIINIWKTLYNLKTVLIGQQMEGIMSPWVGYQYYEFRF